MHVLNDLCTALKVWPFRCGQIAHSQKWQRGTLWSKLFFVCTYIFFLSVATWFPFTTSTYAQPLSSFKLYFCSRVPGRWVKRVIFWCTFYWFFQFMDLNSRHSSHKTPFLFFRPSLPRPHNPVLHHSGAEQLAAACVLIWRTRTSQHEFIRICSADSSQPRAQPACYLITLIFNRCSCWCHLL